jgi:hypothetical protein
VKVDATCNKEKYILKDKGKEIMDTISKLCKLVYLFLFIKNQLGYSVADVHSNLKLA